MNGNNQQREKRQQKPGGVFDQDVQKKPPQTEIPAPPVKEDYHEPSVTDMQNKAAIHKRPSAADQYQEDAADQINRAMEGGGLYDDVEVDEFYVGGEKSGKRGRGAEGKTIVFVAVERNQKQNPQTLELYWEIGRVRMQIGLDCSSFSPMV